MSKSKTYDPKKMMDADYDFGSGKKDGKKSFESQDSDLSYGALSLISAFQ